MTEKYLKLARLAVLKAVPIFNKYYGCPKKVAVKDGDFRNVVTEIDFAIEKLIRKIIKAKFPTHQIIGEETGTEKLPKNNFFWIVDPIDGTSNYVQGLPLACISLALWDKSGPLVGVVYNPITKEMYSAQWGKGAFLNGKKISVAKTNALLQATGSVGWTKPQEGIEIFSKTIVACRKIRVLATAAWQMCLVASGSLDFFAGENVNLWDHAGATLIILEAGGQVTDISGKKLTPSAKSIIASNGKIHKELVRLYN